MNKIIYITLLILWGIFIQENSVYAAPTGFGQNNQKIDPNQYMKNRGTFVPGQVLVKFNNRKSSVKAATIGSRYGIQAGLNQFDNDISIMHLSDGIDVLDAVKVLSKDPNVEFAQPNYVYKIFSKDSDDKFEDQWALENTGQKVKGITGTKGADVHAPEAWAIADTVGIKEKTIVAVIDSGVAYNHPDLKDVMWNGIKCRDDKGKIIDGGCPNHGWDFDDNNGKGSDNDPAPGGVVHDPWFGTFYLYHPHGTHVAGIIAASDVDGPHATNRGIEGLAKNSAVIMSIKTADFTTLSIVKGIKFAEYNKARVINASWGGPAEDIILENAVKNFSGLFIAAAGNDGFDAASTTPCNIKSENVICVGASDQDDILASFSNYGKTVHVAAPGSNIVSSVPKTELLNERMEKVVVGEIPKSFKKTTDSNWQVRDTTYQNFGMNYPGAGIWFSNALYGDSSFPYSDNANSIIDSKQYNLHDAQAADISFETFCDTQFDEMSWHDYMSMELSGDNGTTWSEVQRWDEASLGGNAKTDFVNGSYQGFLNPQLLGEKTKIRFRWVSDDSDNNHGGCFIDNIMLTSYNRGNNGTYDYLDGTSMATPYVVGLAALLWSVDPSLKNDQIKSIITTTGDLLVKKESEDSAAIPSEGIIEETVLVASGKRINAENALLKLSDTEAPKVTTHLGNGKKSFVIRDGSSDTISFSETLNSVSKVNIEKAIKHALRRSMFDGTVTFTWSGEDDSVTINVSGRDALFLGGSGGDVIVTIADIMGNAKVDVVVIDVKN